MVLVLGLGFSAPSFAGTAMSAGPADTASTSSAFYRVYSQQTNSHRIYFHRGDTVDISLSGDGATDLDLYVYDAYGNLCARRTGLYDDEEMSLDVYQTGYFTINVVNRGWDYNDYALSVEVY
jgi:hypothetical protein